MSVPPTPMWFRWKNYRSFRDTGEFAIRPLTILIGANAAGKSAIHSPFLLLKQTVEATDPDLALKTRGEILDCGEYRDFVHMREMDREVEFAIEYHRHHKSHKKEPAEVGRERPGRVTVSFAHDPESQSIVLSSYSIRDEYGREMLTRNRLSTGIYSLNGPFQDAAKPRSAKDLVQRNVRSEIRNSDPVNFLFSDREAARTLFRELSDSDVESPLSEITSHYLAAVSFIQARTMSFLDSTAYVGPLRARPMRSYALSAESPQDVGPSGVNTAELIARASTSEKEGVEAELARFGYRARLKTKEYESGQFSLVLESPDGQTFNYADAGFGVSQLLPILFQGLIPRSPSELLIAEQPEIHLNPRLQAQLGSFFADVSKTSPVVVETHSEHLLLRVRRLVADEELDPYKVGVFYVERDDKNGESHLRPVPIQENGAIDPGDWPKGFFGDSTAEAVAITKAQLRSSGGGNG